MNSGCYDPEAEGFRALDCVRPWEMPLEEEYTRQDAAGDAARNEEEEEDTWN